MYGVGTTNLGGHDHAPVANISLANTAQIATLVGDVPELLDHAIGGDDTLQNVGFPLDPIVIGDALTITDHAEGGSDQLIATGRGSATALGDASTLSGHAHGGNDNVTADATYGTATAYGDASMMSDYSIGGDDVVTGFSLHGSVTLYGDAETLSGNAIGGNDTLIATPAALTQMYGDGLQLLDHATGGNDRLISGAGNDQMWGDAAVVAPTAARGANTFVFSGPNGQDTIMDFQQGKDHIELDGYGLKNFKDVASHIQYTADGALITFDASDSILLVGINHLAANDFILG
jgi:hypothetical protein